MAESIEVTSSEDSRVMEFSFHGKSNESVQSTPRSRKRRFLLAVAPVLGLALAGAGVLSEAAGSGRNTLVSGQPHLKGDTPTLGEKFFFREILKKSAEPVVKEYPALKVREPDVNQEHLGTCPEDSDDPQNDAQIFKNYGPNSEFGLAAKCGLEYIPFFQLQPTDGRNQLGECRAWSKSNWILFCGKRSGAAQGGESAMPAPVVSAPVVTWALRAMFLDLPSNANKSRWLKLYKETRPYAYAIYTLEDDIDGRDEPWDEEGAQHLVLLRPASRARSLFDLTWELRGLVAASYQLNLARSVHSALRQLPHFYRQTEYSFHGGLSSHFMEVLVDGGGTLMAYPTGYADAILWHMKVANGDYVTLGRLSPPEAKVDVQKDLLALTDKTDTWSAGLALAEKLCHYYPEPLGAAEAQRPAVAQFVKSCRHSVFPVPCNNLVPSLDSFVKKTLAFCREEAPELGEALKGMMALNVAERWSITETLDQLGRTISELEKREMKDTKRLKDAAATDE